MSQLRKPHEKGEDCTQSLIGKVIAFAILLPNRAAAICVPDRSPDRRMWKPASKHIFQTEAQETRYNRGSVNYGSREAAESSTTKLVHNSTKLRLLCLLCSRTQVLPINISAHFK